MLAMALHPYSTQVQKLHHSVLFQYLLLTCNSACVISQSTHMETVYQTPEDPAMPDAIKKCLKQISTGLASARSKAFERTGILL